jgi:hypothetical protein
MEAIRSSETSGTTQRTTRRHIPEEDTLHIQQMPVIIQLRQLPLSVLSGKYYNIFVNFSEKKP